MCPTNPIGGTQANRVDSEAQPSHPEYSVTQSSSPSPDASVMVMQTPVTSKMGQAAHVRITQRQAHARAVPPVTAETATSIRYGWRREMWAEMSISPKKQDEQQGCDTDLRLRSAC